MTVDTAALRELLGKATKGPWLYRPHQYDDWGVVRAEYELGWIVLQASAGRRLTDEEAAQHRAAKTDPYGPNAQLIIAMHAALPALLDEVDRMRDLVQHMLGAIDGGHIDSEQIDGDYDSGIPPHKWHEEWAYYARAALGRSTS